VPLPTGPQIITAEVFSGRNAGGTKLATSSLDFTIEDTPPPGETFAVHYNVGGGSFTAQVGTVFEAAPAISNGTIKFSTKAGSIANTQDDALYQTYGTGTFGYDIAVPEAGEYRVELHLADRFWTAPGQRVFDVALEGGIPDGFDDIDVVGLTGGRHRAITLSETVTVTDGVLDIDVTGLVDNGLLNAFSIQSVDLLA
jgi:hypothetical protein